MSSLGYYNGLAYEAAATLLCYKGCHCPAGLGEKTCQSFEVTPTLSSSSDFDSDFKVDSKDSISPQACWQENF
jgi:hypothetical protein